MCLAVQLSDSHDEIVRGLRLFIADELTGKHTHALQDLRGSGHTCEGDQLAESQLHALCQIKAPTHTHLFHQRTHLAGAVALLLILARMFPRIDERANERAPRGPQVAMAPLGKRRESFRKGKRVGASFLQDTQEHAFGEERAPI